MKTLIFNETNESRYVDTDFTVTDESVICAGGLIFGDLNSSNASVLEVSTVPDDWFGNKYLYTVELGWILNPDFVEIVNEEIIE